MDLDESPSMVKALISKIGNKMQVIANKLHNKGEQPKAEAIDEANELYVSLSLHRVVKRLVVSIARGKKIQGNRTFLPKKNRKQRSRRSDGHLKLFGF